VLSGPAGAAAALIEPGDAISVIGRVTRLDDAELAVVVTDAATIVIGTDPNVAGTPPDAEPVASQAPAPSPVPVRTAGLTDDLLALPGGGAGLVSVLLIGVASVAVTLLRREQARRRVAARVAARLAAVVAGPPPDPGPQPDLSVGHARPRTLDSA
jgi:hypothetical protein